MNKFNNLLNNPVLVSLFTAFSTSAVGYFINQAPSIPEGGLIRNIIIFVLIIVFTVVPGYITWQANREEGIQKKRIEQIDTYIQTGNGSKATNLTNNTANISVYDGQVEFQTGDSQPQTYSLSDDEAIKSTLRSLLTWGSLEPPRRVFPTGWLISVFLSYSAIGYSLCHFQRTVSPESFGRLLPFLNGFLPTDIAVILALLLTGAGTLAGALAGSRSIVMLIGLLFAMTWGSSIFYLGPIVGVIVLVIAISLAWSRIGAELVLGAGALAISIVTAGCLAGAVWLTRSLEIEQNSSSLEYLSSLNAVPQWCMAFSFGVSIFGIVALVRVGDKMGNSLSRFGRKWMNFSITYPLLLSMSGLGITLGCQVFAR